MKIELVIDGKEKIYTVAFIKSRMFRKLLAIRKRMNFDDIGEDEMDELVGFVCEVFDGQFTVDEVYDGLSIDKLMPTITEVMNTASGSTPAESAENSEGASDGNKKK